MYENEISVKNIFVDNTVQARSNLANVWSVIVGNYWNDFDESGEGAYDNDSDGIVDTAYTDIADGSDEDDNITREKGDLEGIKADIRQGKEYEVIALKWGTTPNYVRKIASEMRKQGEELIRRNTEAWRTLQFLTRDYCIRYDKERIIEY
jgi:hypothetical protein